MYMGQFELVFYQISSAYSRWFITYAIKRKTEYRFTHYSNSETRVAYISDICMLPQKIQERLRTSLT